MVANPARLGGFLVAGGFAVYLAVGALAWYIEPDLTLVTIFGTMLVWAGASRILAVQQAPPAVRALVPVGIIGGFLAGIVAQGLEFGSGYTYALMAQGLGFTLGGVVALVPRGSFPVRALGALALLGNVLAALVTASSFEAILTLGLTFEQFRLVSIAAVALDNLALLAALAFALQQPAEAPAEAPLATAAPPATPPSA